MHLIRSLTLATLFALPAGGAFAQETTPIATDRPGFLFSSLAAGRGVFQAELGLPQATLAESDDFETRSSSLVVLLRYGLGGNLEVRLGAPVYTRSHTESGPFCDQQSGYGDLEVGAKWHLLDNQGGRPSLALIPSLILPTGEEGFSAGDPVYQLNIAAEWALVDGWGLAALAGALNGPAAGGRYDQQTFALSLGRALPAPAWSAYGEAACVATDLDGASDSSSLGAGIKYLVSNDVQLDLSCDHGLTDGSPDWLLGLGLSARF